MAIGVDVLPPAAVAVPTGTGQKNDVLSRAGKSPAARVNLNVRVSSRTVMPLMCDAFPERNAVTPTRSASSPPAGLGSPAVARRGDSARSIVYLNVSAVRGRSEGGENRNPGRI